MPSLTILYDGRPLVHQPNHPAALHLLTLLHYTPEQVKPIVALPGDAPAWLPAEIETVIEPTDSQLRWEQRTLPQLCRRTNTDILHPTSQGAALFPNCPTVVSPAGYGPDEPTLQGFSARIAAALGAGGTARAAAVLWPEDLPAENSSQIIPMPAVVHPAFTPAEDPEPPIIPGTSLPADFILYHGPGSTKALNKAIETWTWAAGPLGDFHTLVFAGLDAYTRSYVENLASSFDVETSVLTIPLLAPDELAALYQSAAAVFHPAEGSPWEGAVRLGLACGKGVVTKNTPLLDALVGPAAYLAETPSSRDYAAGLISMLVTDNLAIDLESAANKRAAHWHGSEFSARLLEVYLQVKSR